MNLLHLFLIGVVCVYGANVVVNPITGITTNNLMFTGTIPVSDSSSSNLFFTFYGIDGQTDQSKLQENPLIIAVSNPGSSSQYLNLGGVGPLNLNNDLSLKANDGSVTKFANVMFLDLLGAGFSFAASTDEIPKTHADFGKQLTYAINAFISQADIGKSDKIYILGEGTFIRSVQGLDDIDPLQGIIHIGPWPDFYELGKYYGVAGIDLSIFTNSQRIAIETTFVTCFNYQRNNKFTEAHDCYDSTLNFIEGKTKNWNLFNVQNKQNLTDFIPMVFYYFSQDSVVSKFKAPTTGLFETQSALVLNNLYSDMGKNYDTKISQYFKDYLSVKHIFIVGESDFISYKKAVQTWLEEEVTFVESNTFKSKKLQDYEVDGEVVGFTKAVKQIGFFQLKNCGHYAANNKPTIISTIIKGMFSVSDHGMLQSE